MATVEIRRLSRTGINFSNVVWAYFFIDTAMITSLTVHIALGWKRFILEVDKLERIWLTWPYNLLKVRWKYTCWSLAVFWMALAIVEHCMAAYVHVYTQYRESLRCRWLYSNTIENYAHRNYSYIFNWMPYNVPVLLFVRYITFAVTMAWTYQDVLIMVVSVYIKTRYRQFFWRVEASCGGVVLPSSSFWVEVREHYVILSEFLESVDKTYSVLVISSCVNNIFLICYLFLHSLKPHAYTISFIYFWYSLFFFTGRTVATLWTASEVHREIRSALRMIQRIPSEAWCSELERYYWQLRAEVGALSGSRFFYLTHQTSFTIAAVIFTYELVMIKYSRMAAVDVGIPENCSAMAFSQD
ncbi:gustatory receptor for sugar taste 64a-like [Armigeres subalbatus]|uniref:gustatory receptor for sugar taste 64a-like n=1 Tax=Armigeres subalbatus TaxID=124917 RepID=UPI002ED4C081